MKPESCVHTVPGLQDAGDAGDPGDSRLMELPEAGGAEWEKALQGGECFAELGRARGWQEEAGGHSVSGN